MSKLKLASKIGLVSTTVLASIALTGTKIALENKNEISSFLGQPTFEIQNNSSENTDTEYFKSRFPNVKELVAAGRELGEKIEGEGAVLLTNNNNALPLAKNSNVSLVGISSVDPAYGGRGSAQTSKPQPPVTPKEGMTNAGFKVNPELDKFYTDSGKTYKRGRNKINDASWDNLKAAGMDQSIADWGGTAVFTITRVGGEGGDFARTGSDGTNGDYLSLSPNEISVLQGLTRLKKEGKIEKIVLLINTSNQIATKYLNTEGIDIDAQLWIGSTGVSGFNAVGKILSGEINPSGHLSDMHWNDHSDNPVEKNQAVSKYANTQNFDLPSKGGKVDAKYDSYTVYQEGVYLGYRYAETRYSDVVTKRDGAGKFNYNEIVTHPFGYGLSYTDFEYSNMKVERHENYYEVSVDVKNVGKVAGKDAVEVYLQKPYTDFDIKRGIEKPAVELVGFTKTKLLEPNETQTVTVNVNERDFAVFDANVDKTYIITPGEYTLTVGHDAHDAINNILASQGKTTADGMTADGSKSLTKSYNLKYNPVKYSKVESTGTKITTLFDESDINKYDGEENKVTYVSRSNWEATLPTAAVKLVMTDKIAADLVSQDDMSRIAEDHSYKQEPVAGPLKLIDLRADKDGNKISYDNEMWDQFLDQLTWDELTLLLSSGIRKTIEVPSIGKPGTVDHNGPAGLTQPYGESKSGLAFKNNDPDKELTPPYYPCAPIFTATFNPELATEFGDMLGEDALWAGYAGFYGIAINTHRSAYEGRAYEYLSEDPILAGIMATNEVIALQAHGCNAYIKHFALNDQETQRNGNQVWLNEQTFREIYLRPFEMTVLYGDAMNAMAAFNRIGTNYAPAYKALMTDFLRTELGMKGLVVTDMYSIGYTPEHMPTFLMAGCDLPDGTISQDLYLPYKDNAAFRAAMRESAHHILYSTVHSNAMNGINADSVIVSITPAWQKAVYAADGVLGALFLISAGLMIFSYTRKKEDF